MAKNWMQAPLDIDFVIESGLLFELNRQMFHPLGIAMSVKVDEKGNKTWAFKDFRGEPEKAVFDKNLLAAGRAKYEKFMTVFGFPQMDRRIKKLGISTQHVEAWTSK